MSGIVGSKFNIRGSGLVGSLGTDGQHMLSSGPGKSNVFETAAGGGKFTSVHYKQSTDQWQQTCANTGTAITDGTVAFNIAVTPAGTDSKFIIGASFSHCVIGTSTGFLGFFLVERAISGGATTDLVGDAYGVRYRGTHGVGHAYAQNHTGPCFQMFDAPSTASAVTYTLQLGTHSATNTCSFGYPSTSGTGSAAGWDNTGICQMWVFEYDGS